MKNQLTETELYNNYGYLMDKEHRRDTELLVDILERGLNGVFKSTR